MSKLEECVERAIKKNPGAFVGVVSHLDEMRGFCFVTELGAVNTAFLHIKTIYQVGFSKLSLGEVVIAQAEFADSEEDMTCEKRIVDVYCIISKDGSEVAKYQPAGRILGHIKIFNKDRGYGFLVPESGGPEIFVHMKEMVQGGILSPTPGEMCSFEVAYHDNRIQARSLRPGSGA